MYILNKNWVLLRTTVRFMSNGTYDVLTRKKIFLNKRFCPKCFKTIDKKLLCYVNLDGRKILFEQILFELKKVIYMCKVEVIFQDELSKKKEFEFLVSKNIVKQ